MNSLRHISTRVTVSVKKISALTSCIKWNKRHAFYIKAHYFSSEDKPRKQMKSFTVDRSDLMDFSPQPESIDNNDADEVAVPKETLTELGEDLRSYIQMRGPITLHDYVQQAATHFVHGYYQNDKSKIGVEGDFVTAPEISQLFGESIAIWCMLTWQSLGSPEKITLVECGPGNGTLMKDILRAISKFPYFKKALQVNMIEVSPKMRQLQREKLGCPSIPKPMSTATITTITQEEENNSSISTQEKIAEETLSNLVEELSHINSNTTTTSSSSNNKNKDIKKTTSSSFSSSSSSSQSSTLFTTSKLSESTKRLSLSPTDMYYTNDGYDLNTPCTSADGISITWYSSIRQLPIDPTIPMIFIGQEFLDAFPVHQFVKQGLTWREKLIDNEIAISSPYHFRAVLSPVDTPASRVYPAIYEKYAKEQDEIKTQLLTQITPSTNTTQLGKDFTTTFTTTATSSSCNTVKATDTSTKSTKKSEQSIEMSPLTLGTCEYLAEILSKCRGAACMIDYGEYYTQGDTLRGFKKHQQVSVLSQPGDVDVTTDVDFFLCTKIIQQRGCKVLPLLTQGQFLMNMGIIERVEKLIEKETVTDDQAEEIVTACERLISPEQMGSRYKVMIFMNKELTIAPLEDSQSQSTTTTTTTVDTTDSTPEKNSDKNNNNNNTNNS